MLHIKEHLDDPDREKAIQVRHSVYELTEFLVDILKVENLSARFPHRVGLHVSCHGQRGLHISSMSELVAPAFSKTGKLLSMVEGLEMVQPARWDECCGFGGTFCVFEEAVSVKMGKDRIKEHRATDVEYITSNDVSCLMHPGRNIKAAKKHGTGETYCGDIKCYLIIMNNHKDHATLSEEFNRDEARVAGTMKRFGL